MKLIYMGTPDFAVPALRRLAACAEHEIVGVFTQPDKPQGRKMLLTPPDVKVCAQELGLPVFQPASMKSPEALALVQSLEPDAIVVAAYGQILPKAVLDVPRLGCVNIHGSLLPRYRGAAPIQQAVLNGDRVTGVTTMLMDVGLDTGDLLLKAETAIGENETAGELFDRLALLGGDLIVETLAALESGAVTPQKQDEALATHTAKITKALCPIDWTRPAQEVHNQVRGLNPWPVATAVYGGKRLKIYTTRLCESSGKPGEVIAVKPLTVACGSGSVILAQLQPEGKKRMSGEAFVAGYRVQKAERFFNEE